MFTLRACGCSLAFVLLMTVSSFAQTRTNLIAIVTDDQGRWGVSAYDNPEVRTPNMDRLATEGALFTNAFCITPVCSPSRGTYMTGLYPTEFGITDFLSPQENEAGLGLQPPTWPQVLHEHGYRTAMIGKWHLGTQPQFHPTRRGFDHFFGFLGGGNTPMNPTLEVNGQQQQLTGSLPDLLVDDCIGFVESNRERPFAVCLHFRAPHLPYGPVPEVDSAQYSNLDPTVPQPPGADVKQLKTWTRDYYASISSVDRNLGRLLDALDRLALSDRTLITFTSDHGYNNGRHGVDTKGNAQWIAGGVRGPKRPNMWDTSIRVPLLARWPAVIKPGTRIDDYVATLDMHRTVLGALAIPLPQDSRARGIDFSPLLRGQSLPPRDALFGLYDLHNGGLAYMRMIRTPRYKLVRHFKAQGMDELYDLQVDPGEENNLFTRAGRSGPLKDVVESLQNQLSAWQAEIGDPLLKSTY